MLYIIHFIIESSCFSFCNFVLEIWYNMAQLPRLLTTNMQLEPPSDARLHSVCTTVEGEQNSQVSKNWDISQKETL
jgi:hypothetical protein